MNTLKKLAIGCFALAAMAVTACVGMWGWVKIKQVKYDKVAVPFIESYLIQLAHWEPERVHAAWAPEVASALDPEQTKRMFLLYSKLGDLQSFEPVTFRQVGANTKIPYPEIITYQVLARFQGGPATITFQLVRPASNELKIWYLHVDSTAFLPQIPAEGSGSEVGGKP